MLKNEFKLIAGRMTADLSGIRERFTHSGNKGASAEAIFRDFLKCYLPRRFDIKHGEVIDREWRRSNQTDVVILNDNHPFMNPADGPGLFFIEGVAGVGEIKTTLTSEEISNTFIAARKYKKMKMIVPSGALFCCSTADCSRYYIHPPYFLFSFESGLSDQTLIKKVLKEAEKDSDSPGASIDAVFILDRNISIYDLGKGDESFEIRDKTTKKAFKGWYPYRSENVLFDFMTWFSIVMPVFSGGTPVLAPYLLPPDKKESNQSPQ